jgi:hypothetical protein
MDKFLNTGTDWLEHSKLAPVIGGVCIIAFALWHIWKEMK